MSAAEENEEKQVVIRNILGFQVARDLKRIHRFFEFFLGLHETNLVNCGAVGLKKPLEPFQDDSVPFPIAHCIELPNACAVCNT